MKKQTRFAEKVSTPEQHQRVIARRTLRMPDAIANVMGGPSKAEARRILSAGLDESARTRWLAALQVAERQLKYAWKCEANPVIKACHGEALDGLMKVVNELADYR